MGKILNFENNEDMPDFMIKIERSEEFDNAAKELSAFVLSLPLSHEDNDKLVKLIVDQVCMARKEAFDQGAQWGALLTELDTQCPE